MIQDLLVCGSLLSYLIVPLLELLLSPFTNVVSFRSGLDGEEIRIKACDCFLFAER